MQLRWLQQATTKDFSLFFLTHAHGFQTHPEDFTAIHIYVKIELWWQKPTSFIQKTTDILLITTTCQKDAHWRDHGATVNKKEDREPWPNACVGKSAPKYFPAVFGCYVKELHWEKSTISKGLDYQKPLVVGLPVVNALTTRKWWSKWTWIFKVLQSSPIQTQSNWRKRNSDAIYTDKLQLVRRPLAEKSESKLQQTHKKSHVHFVTYNF